MQIELKNIKIGFGSEETLNYEGYIYVDGNKVAYAHNDGHGAMTDITALTVELRAMVTLAEEYCAKIKDEEYSAHAQATRYHSLDSFIDSLAYAYETNRKLERLQKKNVMYGDPKTDTFTTVSWKGKTIAQMLADEKLRGTLKRQLQTILAKLKPNETIMNTNLSHLLTELKQAI